jgi:pimeloyl-ACP methyl ester carboxylesterase
MSTGNAARDIAYNADLMGEEEINYLGASYGSFLGMALVNLFPERVRAVVLDGILDPIAWTTGRPGEEGLPFSTRLGSDASAAATLDEFFRLCDGAGPSGCAFAGDAEARFAAMADTLRSGPVVIIDPGSGMPFELTYAELVRQTLGALYDSFSWSNLAALMAYAESQLGLAPAPTASVRAEAGDFRHATRYTERPNKYPNFVEGHFGVACSDTDNPDGHEHWSIAGADADAEHGYFGRLWTWSSSPCAVWSGADDDRFMGPFDAVTEHPVLVVGTTYDPATPYAGAEVVDDLLPNSSLLTVAGWGHTSLFLSQCADAIVFEYLLTATAPAGGAVCQQDFNPFDIPPAPLATPESADRHQVRTELLGHVAFQPPSLTR